MLADRSRGVPLGVGLGTVLSGLVILAHEAAHYALFAAFGLVPHGIVLWPPGVTLATDALAAMPPAPRALATLGGPVVGMLACVGLSLALRRWDGVRGAASRVPPALLLLAQAILTLNPADPLNDGGAAAADVGATTVLALACVGALVGGALLVWALLDARAAWVATRAGEAPARPARGWVPAIVRRSR